MPFNDDEVTDLARFNNAIGGLKVIMDTLSYTGDGIPFEAHTLLAKLEERANWIEMRDIVLKGGKADG